MYHLQTNSYHFGSTYHWLAAKVTAKFSYVLDDSHIVLFAVTPKLTSWELLF